MIIKGVPVFLLPPFEMQKPAGEIEVIILIIINRQTHNASHKSPNKRWHNRERASLIAFWQVWKTQLGLHGDNKNGFI